jgi:Tol biopolymer transport system component
VISIALSLNAGADEKRAFEIADYYRTAFVGSPVMSPDGATVVFSVGRYELETGTIWSEIWAMAADGKNLRQLTRGRHHDSSPVFSPDGVILAFLSSREGDESQTHLLPMNGGEARPLTSFPGGVSAPVWSPDGAHIVVTSEVYPECGADADCNRTIRQSVADGAV